jgi:hypothetical protein
MADRNLLIAIAGCILFACSGGTGVGMPQDLNGQSPPPNTQAAPISTQIAPLNDQAPPVNDQAPTTSLSQTGPTDACNAYCNYIAVNGCSTPNDCTTSCSSNGTCTSQCTDVPCVEDCQAGRLKNGCTAEFDAFVFCFTGAGTGCDLDKLFPAQCEPQVSAYLTCTDSTPTRQSGASGGSGGQTGTGGTAGL